MLISWYQNRNAKNVMPKASLKKCKKCGQRDINVGDISLMMLVTDVGEIVRMLQTIIQFNHPFWWNQKSFKRAFGSQVFVWMTFFILWTSWFTGKCPGFRLLQFSIRCIVKRPDFQDEIYLPYNNSLYPGLIKLAHVTCRWHLTKLSHDRQVTWHAGQKFNWFLFYSNATDNSRIRN